VTRRPAGALEQEVLSVLAASGKPMTPAQVLGELGGGLAYTTVMTALSRLHAKGAVSRETAGRGYAYRWADQATVTARGMRRLLDGGENRAAVLARFVAELQPEDGKLLEELLGEAGEAP
jgi:predicted transcriptional regulator